MHKKHRWIWLLATGLFFGSVVSCGAASSSSASSRAPAVSRDALAHALDVMLAQGDVKPPVFHGLKEAGLLADIVCTGSEDTKLTLPKKKRMASAYYPFSMNVSLERFLRYGYNPDLPAYLLVPNSVRRGEWTLVDGQHKPLPRLWEHLDTLDKPFLVHGVEHEEITPDVFSGAYYSYDMHRALILFSHKGNPVLISVTRQDNPSDVGKKGAVVGKDADWQYLYSGEEGLSRGGLGWVSSYMYQGMSVSVFCQVKTAKGPMLKVGIFKWLQAGWAGINMVRTRHIKEGCKRFATAMKEILERPALASEEVLARQIALCQSLPQDRLRALVRPYIDHIKEADDSIVRKSPFKKMLASGEYLAAMSKEDMIKMLVQGYLKEILGQKSLGSVTSCQETGTQGNTTF